MHAYHVSDESVVCREQRKLDTVRRAELVEDVGQVAFDRVFANRKSLGDFIVGRAGNYPLYNLELARR